MTHEKPNKAPEPTLGSVTDHSGARSAPVPVAAHLLRSAKIVNPTLNSLNGWQRIGVVLSIAWLFFVCSVATYEFFFSAHTRSAVFAYDEIPIGTVWTEKRDAHGAPIKPWEYDWAADETIPKTRRMRIGLFASALFVPLVGSWLLASASTRTFKWVRAGFDAQS